MQRYTLARWWERAPIAPLDLVPELHRYTGRTGSAPLWRHALAQLHVEDGDRDAATDLLATDRQRGEHWVRLLPFDEFWSMSMGFLANVLAAIGTRTERQDALAATHAALRVARRQRRAVDRPPRPGRRRPRPEPRAPRPRPPPPAGRRRPGSTSQRAAVGGPGAARRPCLDASRSGATVSGRRARSTVDSRAPRSPRDEDARHVVDTTATPPTQPARPRACAPDLSVLTSRSARCWP